MIGVSCSKRKSRISKRANSMCSGIITSGSCKGSALSEVAA
ncbi:Uncharacterised protein [Vibrio cholerae]|nr:Uncharacterised protein [Vibrio cholerae]